MNKKKIAFICVHNSCRSQIAEALGKHFAGEKFDFYSAGTETKPQINKDAVRIMKKLYGIDMEKEQYSKLISDIPTPDIAISMEYNAISGKLVLTDGESQKEYQRDLPGFDSYGVYDISEEDIQRVKDSLDSVSSKNKEVSIKVMLKVRGERQMCDLKLHTLWSSIKTDGYIGIVGQLDIVK